MTGRIVAIAAIASVGLVGCGSDGEFPTLTGDAERGRQVAVDNGCAVCHGQHGQGGAAGGFFGLWGSNVTLDDGTTVVADADYLRRAIVDPGDEIVAGATTEMPRVELSDEDVDLLLTWIEALADR